MVQGGAVSFDESLSELDGHGAASNLLDALLLSPASSSSRTNPSAAGGVGPGAGHGGGSGGCSGGVRPLPCRTVAAMATAHRRGDACLQVPYIVTVCCQHLEENGTHLLM